MRAAKKFVLVLAVFVFTTVSNASPGGKIALAGTEVFDPFGILGAPVGEFLNPGTVQCPGYEPTGDPLQPCPMGSRTNTRNTIWRSRYDSVDDRFDGWFIILANGNYAPDFTGPQWGIFNLVFDDPGMGVMIGSWQGVRRFESGTWFTPLHATGRIIGGSFDGAVAVVDADLVGYTPMPIVYVSTHQGVLITVP